MAVQQPIVAKQDAWPKPAVGWYAVGVLLLAATLSFADRQILSLLVGPIRRDLLVSDFQIGLLQGLAFALFFAMAGLPLGYLVDRYSRKWIIFAGVVFWSLMTVLCGFAHSFGYLFVARMGVGLGEAALGPAAWSMLSDLFPKERLPLALSVYGAGTSIGAGLAFLLGASVVGWATGPAVTVAGVGEMYAWQFAFIAVGIPGFLFALLLLTLREPLRRGQRRLDGHAGLRADMRYATSFLRGISRLAWTYLVGIGSLTAVAYAGLAWIPTLLARRFDWSASQAGGTLGLMIMICGVVGLIAGGSFAVELRRRGHIDAPLRAAAGIAALLVVTGLTFPILPTPAWTLAALALHTLIASSFAGLGPSTIAMVTPNDLRGQVSALALMSTSLAGMVLGPLTVAALTTYVFRDDQAIGAALSITLGLFAAIAALALALSLAPLREANAGEIDESRVAP